MPAPTVTSVNTPIGPTVGGASVTITGTNFTGTTGVTIGGVAATSVSVVSDTSLTCTIPAGAAGGASVLVTNASGTNAGNSLFFYVVAVPTDTYIYLKGGRGDGFVPGWTGLFADSDVDVKSEPYRDIHNYSTDATVNDGGVNGGAITLKGTALVPETAADTAFGGGTLGNVSLAMGALAVKTSDEVAQVAPKQFTKVVTFRSYVSSNGLSYPYELSLITGIGSEPRTE